MTRIARRKPKNKQEWRDENFCDVCEMRRMARHKNQKG